MGPVIPVSIQAGPRSENVRKSATLMAAIITDLRKVFNCNSFCSNTIDFAYVKQEGPEGPRSLT